MKYTVRFAHLDYSPNLTVGDVVKRGQVIGLMGSSGQSSAPHLHIDCVEGEQTGKYTLREIEAGKPAASPPRQVNYFIDKELFGIEPVITTYYADPAYQAKYKKIHYGYDVVPVDRHESKEHFPICWPRSMNGKVVKIDFDPEGYGYCISISFDSA